jgi:ABC-type multidrug transport system fused ATPase/permease subunit
VGLHRDRAALTRLARVVLGRDGALLLGLSWAASLVQPLVEWGIAAFLLLFLYTRGLLDARALPRWLPLEPHSAGPLQVWGFLFGLAVAYCLLQLTVYQTRIAVTERAHARLRLLLGYRLLLSDTTLQASRANHYTSEIFPHTTAFLFHSVQVTAFSGQAVMLVAVMLYLAPGETLVGLVGLGLLGILVLYLNRRKNRMSISLAGISAALEQSKVRATRNWLFIRALRLQEQEHRRYVEICGRYYRRIIVGYLLGHLGATLAPLLIVLVMAVIAFANVAVFGTDTANLVAFFYLFFRLQHMLAHGSNVLGGLFTFGDHLRESARFVADMSEEDVRRALAGDRGLGILQRHARPPSVPTVDGSGESPGAPLRPPSLSIRDLTFAWPDNPRAVFDGLSTDVPAGGQLAVVGANGTGKSTLLAILLGPLRPARGRVLLDGVESAEYISGHASAVGYVGPEPYLLAGSIAENLAYGLGRAAADAEIHGVLEDVRLAARVGALPLGLDHRIEENGEGLSAGEKQKLSIARALLRRPRLLILDEPTANIDDESERDITECLSRLKARCTVVIVSHRPGALRNADRTLSLDDGVGRPPAPARATAGPRRA